MLYNYLIFSISMGFISFMVGMILNAFLRKTVFYKNHLSNLNFIKNNKVNTIIGIDVFKWMMKNTFLKFFNQKLKLKNKVEQVDLYKLREEMTISEIDHLIGFLFVTIFALIKSYKVNLTFGLIIMIVNTLMNLYPSLLQQVNKRRIDQLLKKYNS